MAAIACVAMTGIMQVPAASAATGTGFTAGGQVDLTDVAPSGAKQSFAPAAESFSMAVNEQRDSVMRMRVMDGGAQGAAHAHQWCHGSWRGHTPR